MRYEGQIFRPPSEAYSLLVQVTIGCTHNECTFCTMNKDKQFRVRPIEEVVEDLEEARGYYERIEKIFLCDGDALCLSTKKLLFILNKINEIFPEIKRVSSYGTAQDILAKTDEELQELKEAGLYMVYIGAETGNDEILKNIRKGVTRKQIIEAVQKLERNGIPASVTFISGIGGKAMWKENAIDTGTMISEMSPSYVGLLTLLVDPKAEMYKEIENGSLELLTAEETARETKLLLENTNVKSKCVFRSNHASNYVSLKGNLPEDKEKMIAQLERALGNTNLLKEERYRAL